MREGFVAKRNVKIVGRESDSEDTDEKESSQQADNTQKRTNNLLKNDKE